MLIQKRLIKIIVFEFYIKAKQKINFSFLLHLYIPYNDMNQILVHIFLNNILPENIFDKLLD